MLDRERCFVSARDGQLHTIARADPETFTEADCQHTVPSAEAQDPDAMPDAPPCFSCVLTIAAGHGLA